MKYKSIEDLVITKITQNRGTQNFISSYALVELAHEIGINDLPKRVDKKTVALRIADIVGYSELAHMAHVGVSSYELQQRFGISGAEVKRMATKGFLTVVGKERFRMYGKQCEANLYSLEDYFREEDEVIQWLVDNRRRSQR